MGEPIITVANLGKRYVLAHEQRHDTLRDTLVHGARGLLRRWSRRADPGREDFWALRDVNFTVNRGEVVGIIGRNGAGKSTLLKILSRITEPTTGRVGIRGRVASLLEVGTGFHPELSGRENIFLNGAILGMSRAEIRAKFDEIVAFAEVERFLDTPVKHYSSGMYVRLAFAVAAHLEPEILIVDEVLAVGDAAFQKKCLGKIRSVATTEGRTVLLVTHNPSVVLGLCTGALLLQSGKIIREGKAAEVVAEYLASDAHPQLVREAPPSARIAITRASVATQSDAHGAKLLLNLQFLARDQLRCAVEIRLHDQSGQPIAFASLGSMHPAEQVAVVPGLLDVACAIDISRMASGQYGISLKLTAPFIETYDELSNCLSFEHEAVTEAGATHTLRQNWGSGYFTLRAVRTS